MRKLFLLFNLSILFSCAIDRQRNGNGLIFNVENKNIKNGDLIKIKLTNNTPENFYLLLDPLSYLEKESFFSQSSSLHLADINLVDSFNNGIPIEIVDYNCYDSIFDKKANKHFTTRDVLKVKSGKSIVFYVPFEMQTTIKEDCWYGYVQGQMKKDLQYYVCFNYRTPNEHLKSSLIISVQDTLKKNGYKLYDKNIFSNKVPFKE